MHDPRASGCKAGFHTPNTNTAALRGGVPVLFIALDRVLPYQRAP